MFRNSRAILSFVSVILLVVVMLWVGLASGAREEIQLLVEQFGYGGMFLGASLSGFNLVVPFPFITLMPIFVATGFSFWVSVAVIALGMTSGDLVGYALGHTSRQVIGKRRMAERAAQWAARAKNRHPLLPYLFLFLYVAVAPAPNEIIVIPMAFLGYELKKMAPVILVGNIVFNVVVGLVIVGAVSLVL